MNNDTDRINWLEKRERFLMQDYESGEWGIGQYEGNVNDRVFITLIKVEYKTLRDAIDAGIKLTNQTKERLTQCPQCGDPIIQERSGEDWCENCGFPKENRK